MTFDPETIDIVKGFLDKEEGQYLYQKAVEVGRRAPCLEVGSYCGKSALYLGAGCREAGTVLFSIDHHHGSEEQQPGEEYFDPELFDYQIFRMDTLYTFRRTIENADLTDTVIPIVSRSETVATFWRTALGLVFIDGGHSYEAAFADYRSWAGHIVPGGYLLFHDIFKDPNEGGQAPYQVYRLACSSGLFRELPMVKTLGVLQRH